MNLYILKVPENLVWNEFKKYICYISKERALKIEKYISHHKKIISLLTEILLRYCLTCFHKVKNIDIKFTYNDNQKPSLMGISNLYFSISHSCDIISVAIDNYPVGMDLEVQRIIDTGIAKKFFSVEERRQIFRQGNIYKNFFKVWTQKESHLKLLGENFLSLIREEQKSKCIIQTACYNIGTEDVIISISSNDTNLNTKMRKLSLKEVLEMF